MDSSSIAAVGHEAGVLEVRFRNGGVYRYLDVPEEVCAALMEAESKGRFFNRRIRDVYRCQRIRRGSMSASADFRPL
ncbi:MAG TPA: KTSC domain-containing protein [Solirubrobacterales bacterium]|nr:KTSC domain-containing protein [Solirubrobacterales bacterium]